MPQKSISIRAKEKDGITQVRTLIKYPMGADRRAKTTEMPDQTASHFIQRVRCEHNGQTVLVAEWGSAMAKNPYLYFKFRGGKRGDIIKISWADNKGKRDSAEARIQ